MRVLLVALLTVSALSGCLQGGGDDAREETASESRAADAFVPVESHEALPARGPWAHEVPIPVGPGWRDLRGMVRVADYAGSYDMELVAPDGTVRDTCGPAPGCSTVSGAESGVTHGGPGGEDVQHGTWMLRAWGDGVGDVRLGYRARVAPEALVPVGEVARGDVAAAAWTDRIEFDVPPGSHGLSARLAFTAYTGLWGLRLVDPDGDAHGSCSEGCGPTVVNNAGGTFQVDDPAPGTWALEVDGAGEGSYALVLRALVPAEHARADA